MNINEYFPILINKLDTIIRGGNKLTKYVHFKQLFTFFTPLVSFVFI